MNTSAQSSSPITVLSDADVCKVLDTLTKQDIFEIHTLLADALHSYSTATSPVDSGACSENQPARISVKNKDGGTTLFMPATSDVGFGVKIVTLGESSKTAPIPPSERMSSVRLSSETSTTSTTSSKASTSNTLSSNSSRTLDKPSSTSSPATSPNDARLIAPGTSISSPALSSTSPKGSITLLSPNGTPRALINASTLTGFRTALVSCMLFKRRATVHTLTVFGAGLQAFWHIFVALLLRGREIHRLHIVNRDFTRAQQMIMALGQSGNEAVSDAVMAAKMQPSILTPEYVEYTRLLKENVRAADVIFCCTPATEPLFPAAHLTSTEGRRKGRYIAAIGSYKPHMQELHEDILRQAVKGPPRGEEAQSKGKPGLHLHQRHAHEGGAVIVDTIEGAMTEAGEVIRAGIGGEGVVELGELVMLKRRDWKEKAGKEDSMAQSLGGLFQKKSGDKRHTRNEGDGGLTEWLERGNVIYKGVGIGLMDVVVGMEIVRLAEQRGIGTTIPNF